MKWIRRLIRGARWSERYGHHPGTPVLLALIAIAALVGAEDRGMRGAIEGASVMAICFTPLWLRGCWKRGGES